MASGALHHGLRAGMAVFFQQRLFQTACIDADPDGNVPLPAGFRHFFHVLRTADVAGIDADLVDATLRGHQGQAVVEVDIRHQGQLHLLLDPVNGPGGALVGDGQTDDIAARRLQSPALGHRGLHVPGLGVAHALHRHRRAAAHGQPAHGYRSRVLSRIHRVFLLRLFIVGIGIISYFPALVKSRRDDVRDLGRLNCSPSSRQ